MLYPNPRAYGTGLLAIALLGSCAVVRAQGPVLVKDINARPIERIRSGQPREMTLVGNDHYFVADSDSGPRLWRTNGTTAGTLEVTGPTGAVPYPTELTAFRNTLIFASQDTANGRELWTAANGKATLVRDILPGTASSSPSNFHVHGGYVYFATLTISNGQTEVWRSDGTTNGTTRVYTFTHEPRVLARDFTSVGSALYFVCEDQNGVGLWQTDGTSQGTLRVYAGPRHLTRFSDLTAYGGKLWFTGPSPQGVELWSSDGTRAGTKPFIDLWPGSSSSPSELTVVGNRLFFRANAPKIGWELWSTDGSVKGTTVRDINPGITSSMPQNLTKIGNRLYFCADGGQGLEPWYHDTSTSVTRLLRDVWAVVGRGSAPNYFTPLGNGLAFDAATPTGRRLFYSDGTRNGTVQLSTTPTVFEIGVPGQIASNNTLLLFRAETPTSGVELFRSFARPATTSLVKDVHAPPPGETASSNPVELTDVGGFLCFSANDGVHGSEVWISDGTTQGTRLVKDINPGIESSHPNGFYRAPWGILFSAYTKNTGHELWSTLGQAIKTSMLLDINPGPRSSAPQSFVELGSKVLFRATSQFSSKLFETDGTARGTREIASVRILSELVRMGQHVYFMALDGLYRSDGTTVGTKRIAALTHPGPWAQPLRVLGDKLIVVASKPAYGNELWSCDGTTVTLLRDIRRGPYGSEIGEPTIVGDVLYFRASDGMSGSELWKTDGTVQGTTQVGDLEPGFTGSTPGQLTAVGRRLFFSATTRMHSSEIWVSDGTNTGTRIVRDLQTGSGGSFPVVLASLGDRLVFGARSTQLWISDGTLAGTNEVKTGGISFDVQRHSALLLRGNLLFSARAGVTGNELWSWFPGASSHALGEPCAGRTRAPRLAATPPRIGKNWHVDGYAFASKLPAVAFFGAPSPPLPIGTCKLWVDPATYQVMTAVVPTATTWNHQVMIPNKTTFLGITLALQALQVAQDTQLGFDLTNGVHATLGR